MNIKRNKAKKITIEELLQSEGKPSTLYNQFESVHQSGISVVSHTNLNQSMHPKFLSNFNNELTTRNKTYLKLPNRSSNNVQEEEKKSKFFSLGNRQNNAGLKKNISRIPVKGPKIIYPDHEVLSPKPKNFSEICDFDQCEYSLKSQNQGEDKFENKIKKKRSGSSEIISSKEENFFSKSDKVINEAKESKEDSFELNIDFVYGSENREERNRKKVIEEDLGSSLEEYESFADNKSLLTKLLMDEKKGLQKVGIIKMEMENN